MQWLEFEFHAFLPPQQLLESVRDELAIVKSELETTQRELDAARGVPWKMTLLCGVLAVVAAYGWYRSEKESVDVYVGECVAVCATKLQPVAWLLK